MAFAVGVAGKLGRAAVVEIWMPRLADRPTTVLALQVEQQFRLLGILFCLVCHGSCPHQCSRPSHIRPNKKSPRSRHPRFWGDLSVAVDPLYSGTRKLELKQSSRAAIRSGLRDVNGSLCGRGEGEGEERAAAQLLQPL